MTRSDYEPCLVTRQAIAYALNAKPFPSFTRFATWIGWHADPEHETQEWEANVVFELTQARREREKAAFMRTLEAAKAAVVAERLASERWMDAAAAAGAAGW